MADHFSRQFVSALCSSIWVPTDKPGGQIRCVEGIPCGGGVHRAGIGDSRDVPLHALGLNKAAARSQFDHHFSDTHGMQATRTARVIVIAEQGLLVI